MLSQSHGRNWNFTQIDRCFSKIVWCQQFLRAVVNFVSFNPICPRARGPSKTINSLWIVEKDQRNAAQDCTNAAPGYATRKRLCDQENTREGTKSGAARLGRMKHLSGVYFFFLSPWRKQSASDHDLRDQIMIWSWSASPNTPEKRSSRDQHGDLVIQIMIRSWSGIWDHEHRSSWLESVTSLCEWVSLFAAE